MLHPSQSIIFRLFIAFCSCSVACNIYLHEHNYTLNYDCHQGAIIVSPPSQLTRMHGRMPSPTRKSRLYDVKLTFIPLLFLLLRVPDLGLAIPHQYLSYDSRLHFRKTWWNAALVLCAVSNH